MSFEGLREILYADTKRIDCYVNQIDSTAQVKKGLNFTFEISPLPKLTVATASFLTEKHLIEKIRTIYRYLDQSGQIHSGRPRTRGDLPDFIIEHCRATRVLVPQQALDNDNTPSFAFWFSEGVQEESMLCLLEDFAQEDKAPINFAKASTYTVLQSLVFFTREKLRSSVLQKHIPDNPHPNLYAKFDDTSDHPLSLAELHNVRHIAWEFITNPTQLLTDWGCRLFSSRNIEVVYRIREWGPEACHSWQRVTTFGYPIWILAGSSGTEML